MTFPGHITKGLLLGYAASPWIAPQAPQSVALFSVLFAWLIQDLDMLSFLFGKHEHPLWGHRGLTHSLCYNLCSAVLGGWIFTTWVVPGSISTDVILFFLFLSMTHLAVDAMISREHGVALFAPFSLTQYSFPVRPVGGSPIAIETLKGPLWQKYLEEIRWLLLLPISLLRVQHSNETAT